MAEYVANAIAIGTIFVGFIFLIAWVYLDERKRVREKLKEHDDEISVIKDQITQIDVIANDVSWIRRTLEKGDR